MDPGKWFSAEPRNGFLGGCALVIRRPLFPEVEAEGFPELGECGPGFRLSPGGLLFPVGWCHLLVMSTLTAMLFLGGYRLPSQPLGV